MKPGVYAGITNAEYHGGPGVSKSMLDVLAKNSPLHLKYLREHANDNDRQPTQAQMIGTAFHALLLEPQEFVKDYCLGLRMQDVPEAIDDRDQLVAMVNKLNEGRKPKLAVGGTKDELVARIVAEIGPCAAGDVDLQSLKGAELKAIIEKENASRPGLLSVTGSRHDLADLLRANGVPVTLWSDVQAQWLSNNGHRIVLSEAQWDQLHRMHEAVMAHPAASKLFSIGGWSELSAYWVDPKTGELCRCRPDFWRRDGVIVDVKTTEDASEEEFARSIAKWRYHSQHPYYTDGVTQALEQASKENLSAAFGGDAPPPPRAFVFLAVEKDACVVNGVSKGVAVYALDDESIELGRKLYRESLDTFAQCNASGVWPCYGDKIKAIKVPAYEFSRNAHLIAAA